MSALKSMMIKVGLKNDSVVNAVNASKTNTIKVGWTKDSFVDAMESIKSKVRWKKDTF